jgi:Fe-S cluster assembly protein SufD
MSLQTDPREQAIATFQTLLDSQYRLLPQGDALHSWRSKAWERFLQMGLPTQKWEVFRSIRLHQLLGNDYQMAEPASLSADLIAPHILPECRQSLLVLINGRYSPTHSNLTALSEKIVISTLNEASKTFGAFLNSQWTKTLKKETDPFALLNAALYRDGIFLYLPPKTHSQPLQILSLISADQNAPLVMPRLHLFLGAFSQLETVETTALISGERYGVNQVYDLHLEEGAHFSHTQVSCTQPHDCWHFDAFRAHLKRSSNLKTVQVTSGSSTIRYDYRIGLAGEGCEASLNGVCLLKDKREAHTNVLIEHIAPHCRSNQLFKGVLDHFSRSSFEGKIYVHQAAQKTEAFQLNANLLLSDRAHADSKPNLEIFADDVKASHGATIGQLDSDQLFYMKTRGIGDAEARALLVHSFCQEVLEQVKFPSLRTQLFS